MYTNDKYRENTTAKTSDKAERVPIYNIRMMTDDEWNRLAYQNYLRRRAAANG